MGLFGILVLIISGTFTIIYVIEGDSDKKARVALLGVLVILVSISMIYVDATADEINEVIKYKSSRLELSSGETIEFNDTMNITEYVTRYPLWTALHSPTYNYKVEIIE